MQKPEVILADEPVASLDPALTEEVMSLLMRVGSEENRTLVVAVHKVELALERFPRVIGLRGGAVFFDRPSRSVDEDLLEGLYTGYRQERGTQIDKLRREFGCSR